MSLRRTWVITCDQGGCSASILFDRNEFDDTKLSYGESANDAGWDAAPGRIETYCPDHSALEPWWDDEQESAACQRSIDAADHRPESRRPQETR